MKLIPVIDILGGIVVRGVAGNRSEYQPLVSRLTHSVKPLEVLLDIQARLAPASFYIADLDAIIHNRPNHALYSQLRENCAGNVEILLDIGAVNHSDLQSLSDNGITPVLGLESLTEPKMLADAPRDCVFSLDLKLGRPLGNPDIWGDDPMQIMRRVRNAGLRRMIVLDLAAVGMSGGTGTEPLLREIRGEFPEIELIAGGGICSEDSLLPLENLGLSGVLLATALHDGRLTPEFFRQHQSTARQLRG